MTLIEEQRRGAGAASVLNNDIYKEAYRAIEQRILHVLQSADTPDDRRKRMNDLLIALNKLDGYMREVMASGKMAAMQIEQEEQRRSWKEKILRRA